MTVRIGSVVRSFAFSVFIAVVLLYLLFPVYWMVVSALKTPSNFSVVEYIPARPAWANFLLVAAQPEFRAAFATSLTVSSGVLVLTLLIGGFAAYALGRYTFRGRRLVRYLILVMIAFPQFAILTGLYQVLINPCTLFGMSCRNLSLYNTQHGLMISTLLLTLPLTIWFLAAYFAALPRDLEEAAAIDGATAVQTFVHILVPIAQPGLIATGVLTFIATWNEFIFASTLTTTLDPNDRTRTLAVLIASYQPVGLEVILVQAASVLATLPPVILALAFSRQLTAGLTGQAAELLEVANERWWHRWVPWSGMRGLSSAALVLLGLLGVALLGYLRSTWQVLAFPYPVDYGEGPLLDQVLRLARGANIYRPDFASPPYLVTNYPPLYQLLQVPAVALWGPNLLYGRMLSWLSVLVAAGCIALLLWHLTRDRLAALVASLLFLSIPYVSYYAPLLHVDALGLSLSLLAVCVVVCIPERRGRIVLGALLLVAAVYTRQTYGLAAPIAASVWLWHKEGWRMAAWLVALTSAFGLGALLALQTLTAGGFWWHVVTASSNTYQISLLAHYWYELWGLVPVLLIVGALTLILAPWWHVSGWSLLVPYVMGATVVALMVGSVEANSNNFLEFAAALSLLSGAALATLRTRVWLRQALLVVLALQVVLFIPGAPQQLAIQQRLGQRDALAQLADIVGAADGPVLADEELGLLPLRDRPLILQPSEMTRLAEAGMWDQAPLLQAIEAQQFPVILIFKVPRVDLHTTRWTPEMLEVIERRYVAREQIGNTWVYRPR